MITDIDKTNPDRYNPSPNTHDTLAGNAVMSKGTNSVNYVTPGTNDSLITGAKNGQFTIVQVGNFTTTATYTTSAPGTGNFASDSFTLYAAPHNLGFIPGVVAYEISSAGQYSPMPLVKYLVGSPNQGLWYSFGIFVDNTNVYLQLNSMTSSSAAFTFQPGFIFKWYLLQQTSGGS